MLCIIHKINNQIQEHFPFHLNDKSVKTRSPDHYQLKAKAPQQPDQHCMPHTFLLHCHRVKMSHHHLPGKAAPTPRGFLVPWIQLEQEAQRGLDEQVVEAHGKKWFSSYTSWPQSLRKEKCLKPLTLWHTSSSAMRRLSPGLMLMLRWIKEIPPLESCSTST